jgi:hypothetical protein
MNTYSSVAFLHVIAAMGLFAALVIEWMSLRLLRRSASYDQGRESMAVWGLVARVGGPATVVALASGIYLAQAISGAIFTDILDFAREFSPFKAAKGDR